MGKYACYIVLEGRVSGIYMSWAECNKQVNGFKGAIYHGCATKEEVEAEFAKYWDVGVGVANAPLPNTDGAPTTSHSAATRSHSATIGSHSIATTSHSTATTSHSTPTESLFIVPPQPPQLLDFPIELCKLVLILLSILCVITAAVMVKLFIKL